MQPDAILALYDEEQRKRLDEPDTVRVVGPHTIRYVETAAKRGYILYTDMEGVEDVGSIIRDEIAYFEAQGASFEWKVYSHDHPADLPRQLQAHGFQLEPPETICALDLEAMPDTLAGTPRHDIRRIDDPEQVRDLLTQIQNRVFADENSPLPEYFANFLKAYPTMMSFYAAYVDGQPASAAWIRYSRGSQFAGLWGGATLSKYRGRGLYTELVSVRAQEAKARGVRFLTIDASDMSRPIVEKHGFVRLCTATECQWERVRP